MCHALLNLLLNACDALPAGGTIVVRVGAASGAAVQVTVEDDGEGMDAETLRRAVEPLFTTKRARGRTGFGSDGSAAGGSGGARLRTALQRARPGHSSDPDAAARAWPMRLPPRT